jgi:hypothetical protein
MTHNMIQYYKQLARAANARGNDMAVARIVALRLEPLFGDDHRAARAFYTELERTAPTPGDNPMQGD